MKKQPSSDKLRGGYYTPATIARFLARWSTSGAARSALEPSAGDGNILVELARSMARRSTASVVGIELVPTEASRAAKRASEVSGAASSQVKRGDFFCHAAEWFKKGVRFDAIAGNPPFIRYQDFPAEQRDLAFSLMRELGFQPSKLSNIWLPFVAISSALVAERGRLGMVVPAELFQVNYASELRARLSSLFDRITIVAFRKRVFPEIQQEVVLLLCERGGRSRAGVRVVEVEDDTALDDTLDTLEEAELKPVDEASEKWTKYFLDASEILLLRSLREHVGVKKLGHYVDIDVGIVTGNNDYFVMPRGVRQIMNLEAHTLPLVGRSAALSGVVFGQPDFEAWSTAEKPAFLFLPSELSSETVSRYVAEGERLQVHTGYKCRIRKNWYVVPATWRPDVFFLRQADEAPRLVANKTEARCTDTLHRGRLLNGTTGEQLSAAFLNSLTLAASEVLGRSYGGGVMTFEPTEAERLPIPGSAFDRLDVAEIDRLVRARRLSTALDVVDAALLKDQLGLPKRDIGRLRGIWTKLSQRRKLRR